MTGWFALTLIVAVVIDVATIFRFGQRAGGEAERAKTIEAENESIKEVTDAQDRMHISRRFTTRRCFSLNETLL